MQKRKHKKKLHKKCKYERDSITFRHKKKSWLIGMPLKPINQSFFHVLSCFCFDFVFAFWLFLPNFKMEIEEFLFMVKIHTIIIGISTSKSYYHETWSLNKCKPYCQYCGWKSNMVHLPKRHFLVVFDSTVFFENQLAGAYANITYLHDFLQWFVITK